MATATGTARISLAPGDVPAARTGHSIVIRARVTVANGETLAVRLYEGATARSSELVTTALTTSFVTYTLDIPQADANNIASYSDLEIRVRGDSPGGFAAVFQVAELYLLTPAPTGTTKAGYVVLPLTFTAITQGSVTGSGAKTTGVARLSLGTGFIPETRTSHAINVRARRTALQGKIRAQLYEGTTPRSAVLETTELTTSLADYALAISDVDAATISVYSDLEIRVWGYSSTGTATVFEVAQVTLTLPLAVSGGANEGAVVFTATSGLVIGSETSPGVIYPNTNVYPRPQFALESTSTVSFGSTNISFGQVVLPLTISQYTLGITNALNKEGAVAFSATGTIAVAGKIEYRAVVSLPLALNIITSVQSTAGTGQVAFSATTSLAFAGVVTGPATPPTFLSSGYPELPSRLLSIAFASSPLAPLQTYQAVTPYLRGINTQRGRQFELGRVEAGQESFLLSNLDGRFSPENASSPYYPNVLPTRRVRFAMSWSAVTYEIFNGFLEGYPREFPTLGFDSVVRQRAVDAFMALARGKLLPGSTTLTSQMALLDPNSTSAPPAETIGVANSGLPMPQAVPFDIKVDSEEMTVTEIPLPGNYVVQRQVGGTAHAAGAPITTTVVSFGQEYSGTRIINILQRIGLSAGQYDVDAGQSLLAPSEDLAGQNPLEHLSLVAEVDGGRFFAARSGTITFRDRHDQFKNEQSPRATFGEQTGEIRYSDIKVDHDDEKIYNIARITAADGSVAEARDDASVTDHFERVYEKSWPLADPNEALAAAQYIVYRYGRMQERVPELTVKGQDNPTLAWPHLLALELGQRFRVRRRPSIHAGITDSDLDKELLVEGVAHEVGIDQMQTRVQMSLADSRHYWRLEVVGYGELDSNTRLAY